MWKRKEEESGSEGCNMRRSWPVLKTRKESRAKGSLKMLEKARKQILPLSLQKKFIPTHCFEPMGARVLSCFRRVQLFVTPWTAAWQATLSMGFSRQEYWSGLPYLHLGDLSDPGIKLCLLCLLHWQVGPLLLAEPGEPQFEPSETHFRQ